MGLIARVLQAFRGERNELTVQRTKIDTGGGAVIQCDNYLSPGDDSVSVDGDYAYAAKIDHTANAHCMVGFVDPKNAAQALPGEKRLYSRDGDGLVALTLWMKRDGQCHIYNDNGYFRLDPDGKVLVNGVEIDTDGNIATNGKITANEIETTAGIDLGTHIHGGVEPGAGDTLQPKQAGP